MKHALLAASLVLLAGGAVGCGGDSGGGAPSDASKADFCDGYQSLFTDMAALSPDGEAPSDEDSLEAIKSWAEKMKGIGTPEAISDDARAGFEVTIDEVSDLDIEELKETKLEDLGADISDDEKKQAEAFNKYITDNCDTPLMPSAPAN